MKAMPFGRYVLDTGDLVEIQSFVLPIATIRATVVSAGDDGISFLCSELGPRVHAIHGTQVRGFKLLQRVHEIDHPRSRIGEFVAGSEDHNSGHIIAETGTFIAIERTDGYVFVQDTAAKETEAKLPIPKSQAHAA